MARPGSTGSVRAVARALDLLRCFTAEHPLLGVTELGRRLGLSRPTVYRLLATLEKCGFVKGEGTPVRYRLGPAVGPLAHAWSNTLNVQQVATPVLEALRDATGETVGLHLARGESRVCVAELPGSHMLTIVRGVGSVYPLHLGASGKAILAHRPHPGQGKARELEKIRRDGYAVSVGEIAPGIVVVASAVFDRAGMPVGSICTSAAQVRMTPARVRRFGEQVSKAAAEVSALLGHDAER